MHQNAQICMLQFKIFSGGYAPKPLCWGRATVIPQTPSLSALRHASCASLGASIVPPMFISRWHHCNSDIPVYRLLQVSRLHCRDRQEQFQRLFLHDGCCLSPINSITGVDWNCRTGHWRTSKKNGVGHCRTGQWRTSSQGWTLQDWTFTDWTLTDE